MTKAGKRILEGAREALAIAKGESPAASIYHNGFRYIPATEPVAVVDADGTVSFTESGRQWLRDTLGNADSTLPGKPVALLYGAPK